MLSRSPLVLGLGLLSKRYRPQQGQMLLVWGLWTFARFGESPRYKFRQVTYVEKMLNVAGAGYVS